MTVSVIIPTYNRVRVLPRAVDSVLGQSHRPEELIVVDDGSTDDTSSVICRRYLSAPTREGARAKIAALRGRSFPPPAFRYVSQPHRGVSAARNRGIREAKGEWIALLDSDDEWQPEKLQRQLDALRWNPEYRICHTDEIWIRDGQRVNPRQKHAKAGGWIFRRCLPLCCVSPSSVMLHREIFDEIGVFDEELPACEDYDLWLRVTARFPVLFVDEPLIRKYGGHADQLSRIVWGLDRFRIRALEKILASEELTRTNAEAARDTLLKKLDVYIQGARRRGKIAEVGRYEKRRAAIALQIRLHAAAPSRRPRTTSREARHDQTGGSRPTGMAPDDRPAKVPGDVLEGRLNLVVSLAAEARPILEHFGLASQASDDAYPIFADPSRTIWLTISGVGRAASAAATSSLRFAASDPHPSNTDDRHGHGRICTAWLNAGIAGHRSLELGEALLAHKITDDETGRAYYPPLFFTLPCPTASLRTVRRAVDDYPTAEVYEMEAAGFYEAASRHTDHELVHCLKVISDNAASPARLLSAARVSELVGSQLATIEALVSLLRQASAEQTARRSLPPALDVFLHGWHFTQTQRHQLQRVLQRWAALYPNDDPLGAAPARCRDARAVLRQLNAVLENSALELASSGHGSGALAGRVSEATPADGVKR